MDEKEFRSRKHKFIKEFIHLYKSFPCLWQMKSREYHMRHLRANAYKVLTNKLKEIDSGADRSAVVRKINSLRSNLRKEKRRMKDMAKLKIPYQPKLWYYPYFSFLEGHERVRTRSENESEEDGRDATTSIMETETGFQEDYDPLQPLEKSQEEDPEESLTPLKQANFMCQPDLVQENSSQINTYPRISKIYSEKFESPAKHETREDQFDFFGKNVAAKLREISLKDNAQRLMAEKIINDALFLAQMGHLTLSHCNKLNSV